MILTCIKCGVAKPADEFHQNRTAPTGRRRQCKACLKHYWNTSIANTPGDDSTHGLRPEDLVPCARCGLRGHAAGDPDRCLTGVAGRGMGTWTWMGNVGET